jgi:hypothetical protein
MTFPMSMLDFVRDRVVGLARRRTLPRVGVEQM